MSKEPPTLQQLLDEAIKIVLLVAVVVLLWGLSEFVGIAGNIAGIFADLLGG